MTKRPILVPIGPSIAYVPLTKGQFALVDSWIVGKLAAYSWTAQWHIHTKTYYAKTSTGGRKSRKCIGMHALILGDLPCPKSVRDHINGNTLDNRLCNLRFCSQSVNVAKRRSSGASGFTGVYLYKPNQRWQARLKNNGVRINLGYFDTPEEAAAARDAAIIRIGPGIGVLH